MAILAAVLLLATAGGCAAESYPWSNWTALATADSEGELKRAGRI
jgi:hypothetical protein